MTDQSIGAIKVTRMIWTATFLSLFSLAYCWYNCPDSNPSIMKTAMEYPYTIIMRVGLMYSLFILFLINLFIKWWLDSSQIAKRTGLAVFHGTIAIAAYALFVSTIDRKRINYNLAEWGVFIAAVTNFFSLTSIYRNIKRIREQNPFFVGYLSWKLKTLFMTAYLVSMGVGLLIYLGQVDINRKNQMEYGVVVSTYLFYWSFIFDFGAYTMDIDKLTSEADERAIAELE